MGDVTEADVRARVERLLAEHGDDDMTAFLGAQFDAGLARMDYPVGPRRPRRRRRSCRRSSTSALEQAGRRYPWMRNAMGIGMCGPTIVARGTEEQRSASSARSSPPRRSGASCSASRAPAPTSPGSRPAPCATATSGW